MDSVNACHYAGLVLMEAGIGYYIVNAMSLRVFVEQDPTITFAIVTGELLQITVFLGIGFYGFVEIPSG